MFEDIIFPVYRKYKNNKHFFKVISKNNFEEIQIIGNKKTPAFAEVFFNDLVKLIYQPKRRICRCLCIFQEQIFL